MSETTLFALEAVVLLLLFLFVWIVIRSSAKGLRDLDLVSRAPAMDEPGGQRVVPRPPPQEVDAIIAGSGAPASAAAVELPPLPSAPATPPPPVVAAVEPPPPVSQVPTEPVDAAALADAPSEGGPSDTSQHSVLTEVDSALIAFDEDGGPMDLASNIRPRLLIESSPVLAEGTEVELEGGITIGRSRTSQLCIEDAFVSHMHARVFRRGPFFHLEDLGSTNGTYINGRRIEGTAQLKVHDEVRLGETVLRYEE